MGLLDAVTLYTSTELGELNMAMPMTPTGLEGLSLRRPKLDLSATEQHDRCSAFAACGKATKDGKMVIGHVTWWPLTLAEQTNLMLDVQPTQGHRVLMQSYPGGIQSGTEGECDQAFAFHGILRGCALHLSTTTAAQKG